MFNRASVPGGTFFKCPAERKAVTLHAIVMTLRSLLALTFLTILTLTETYGQGKGDKGFTLSRIKKIYRQINDYKNYKTITIDDAEDFLGHGTDNGGSLTGYYKSDSLKKIVEWVGLSNRVVQNEYYFDKGKLVFVYSTDSRYKFNDSKTEFDYSKFDNVFKGLYYFHNDKLIDTILSDKEHEQTKQKDATEFLTSSKVYSTRLNAKRK